MLGITGLLAIFLTAVFAANHKAIFPSGCHLHLVRAGLPVRRLRLLAQAVQRQARGERALPCRHRGRHGGDPADLPLHLPAARGLARLRAHAARAVDDGAARRWSPWRSSIRGWRRPSRACPASPSPGVGAALTLFLALRGQDRALSLVPTWMLLLVWLFGAGVTFTGRLSGDIVVFGLTAGLVLIVVLIGFTVTQYAFRSIEPLYGAAARRAAAALARRRRRGRGGVGMERAPRRDQGQPGGGGDPRASRPASCRPRSRTSPSTCIPPTASASSCCCASVKERAGGELRIEFRMRHADNSYRWFELEAASVPAADRAQPCAASACMREVTDAKRAQERLLHDAVHDSLTGLPNRELFLDRLAIAAKRATLEPLVRPALLFIDIDKFKSVNCLVRPGRRRQPAADRRPPPGPQPRPAGHARRASAATSSRCCCSASPIRASLPCWPSRCAARCARRSTSPARRSC